MEQITARGNTEEAEEPENANTAATVLPSPAQRAGGVVMIEDMRTGHRWAWTGVIVGAALSVAGNAWHVILSGQNASLALRIIAGVIWPVLLMIGIEVLMRVRWRNKVMDRSAQFLLTFPVAAVAAVVSYRHLNPLLLLADPSDRFSATIGPLAVDGLMLGCTLTLLVLRALTLPVEQESTPASEQTSEQASGQEQAPEQTSEREREQEREQERAALTTEWALLAEREQKLIVERKDLERERAESALTDEQIWSGIGGVPATPVSAPVSPPASPSAPRSAPARLGSAVRALIDPRVTDHVATIAACNEVGVSTLRRYARVLHLLRKHGAEHSIDSKAENVNTELVSIIREHVRSEERSRSKGEHS